ncbi:MAG: trypsin-like peptidase domain-containing protein [Candidatus Nanopelagicales bacterium]
MTETPTFPSHPTYAPGPESSPGSGQPPQPAFPHGWGVQPAPAPTDPWAPPPPPPGGGAPTPGRDRKPMRGVALVLAVAAAAGLVGAAAGGVAGYLAADNETVSTVRTVTGSAPAPEAQSVTAVAEQVTPSVVSLKVSGPDGSGEGSGVVMDEEGHILTNNHVVVGGGSGGEIIVTFSDGSTADATVVGTDPSTDIAVVKVNGVDNLQPITFGSSADLRVGDQVVAVGSPLGLEGTVTTGIVSALGRPVSTGDQQSGDGAVFDGIQTDAAINPGNSGGALVDVSGRLVGINTAIASLGAGGQSGSIGLGFAIPVDLAHRIAQELISSGEATHARLGVSVGSQDDGAPGAVLGQVEAGSAAEQAGLQAGDVVTAVDGRVVEGPDGLVAAIRSMAPGEEVTLTYERNGETATTTVTLGSDADAQSS